VSNPTSEWLASANILCIRYLVFEFRRISSADGVGCNMFPNRLIQSFNAVFLVAPAVLERTTDIVLFVGGFSRTSKLRKTTSHVNRLFWYLDARRVW
jgi:hypothetical protein